MLKHCLAYGFLLCFSLIFSAYPSYAQGKNSEIKRVAVLELNDNSKGLVTAEERLFLSNLVRQAANRLPQDRFMVMTQENIIALLPEGKTLEDCMSKATCEVTMGRELGADYIITGEVVKFGESLRIALKLHESSSGALKSSDTISGNKVEELEGNIQGSAIGLFSELDPSLKKSAERLKKGFIYEKISLVDTSVLDTNNQKSLSKLENEQLEIPTVQSEIKGINFGSVNVDALQAYQDAVDLEKNNNASIQNKKQAWEKVAQFDQQSDLGRLANERVRIWDQQIQHNAYQKVIDFDQSNASTSEKINQWKNLARQYPSYQNIAQQRVNEWQNWQLKEDQKLTAYEKIYDQMIATENKRSQKRDEDWAKLSKLLKLTVISEDDKNSWVEAFIEAYGVHELLNPYYLKIDQKYRNVVQDRYEEILTENRAELKNRLLVLLKAPRGFWDHRELSLWDRLILSDTREEEISQMPTFLQNLARIEIKKIETNKLKDAQILKDRLNEENLRIEEKRKIIQTLQVENGFELIFIKGGSFQMGREDGPNDEKPTHNVIVRDFYISKTEVTVGQYKKCVEAKVCSKPGEGGFCNWDKWFVDNHPINCVNWSQALIFATWVGGHLPSEVQWEYAARSGGKNIKYPWGNVDVTCDVANYGDCYDKGTIAVCSKEDGNTMQGVCDMGGNVWEWLSDEWHKSYVGAPTDDMGWCTNLCDTNVSVRRVSRGGSFGRPLTNLRSTFRFSHLANIQLDNLGFRILYLNN